ncbi:hypothetical protein C8J56DRAFT_897323 [Mycena floridula]|nr:hypothetical protein C8J56DRAFT_897323 [Mycena floridula]
MVSSISPAFSTETKVYYKWFQFTSSESYAATTNRRLWPEGITWVTGGPEGITWVNGGPEGVTWVTGGPEGVTWVNGGPEGVTWVNRGPEGVNWVTQYPEGINRSIISRQSNEK